jgi:DNA polymerase-3 subunit epsilon
MTSDRTHAISIAQDKLKLLPVYLDTETTGLDRKSEIIEICVVNHDDRVLYHSLVRPTSPISAEVTRIHGITTEMVKDAPNWLKVWPAVQEILLGKQVGVYNADFDIRMIQQTNARYGLPSSISVFSNFFCIMKLFAQYFGDWDRSRGSYRWQSLESAGRHCRIPITNSHRAEDDTRLARAVLHYMAHQTT